MFSSLFLKGWLIGFFIAMPVGPIGMLCVKHSLVRGMSYGLVSGIGAALADAIYGALAGLGVSAISSFLSANQVVIQLVGGLFLSYLGLTTMFAQGADNCEDALKTRHWRIFLATFFLTLTNPMTVLSFAGIYAGLSIGVEQELLAILLLTCGIFIGSAAWWLMLSMGAAVLGRNINIQTVNWLNKISGIVILAFGVVALLSTCVSCWK